MKKLNMRINSILNNCFYGKFCGKPDSLAQTQVTINSKLDINTLIEKLKINDIHDINTSIDGVVIKCTSDKFNVCKNIINSWAGFNKINVSNE